MDNMSSPAYLLCLPTELFHMITAYLVSGDFYVLTRVCRDLQRKIEPMLYKSITLRNKHGPGFADAIERIPARAKYIVELKIHYDNNSIDEHEKDPLKHYARLLSPTIERLVNLRELVFKDQTAYETRKYLAEYDKGVRMFGSLVFQMERDLLPVSRTLKKCKRFLRNRRRKWFKYYKR